MKPFQLLVLSMTAFISSCDEMKFPVHRVPSGYEGFVVVIMNQPGFPELRTEGKYQIVKYPSDGILITSSPLKFGIGADHVIERYPVPASAADSKLRKSENQADSFGTRESKDGFKFSYYVKAIGSDAYWSTRSKSDYSSKITEAENKLRGILNN